MLKKIGCLLMFLIIFMCHSKVFAATYSDKFDEHGMWISNEFVNKTKNGSTNYQQMTMIVRKSDNRFVYCIEPGKSINENNYLIGYDKNQHSYANLTLQQWDRIKLLAYYGYGYKDHTDIKWYVITQFMIWQTNNLGYDIYFTDKLNGNRIEKYTTEMIELDNLVNSHFKIPNFNVNTFDLFWGEQKNFVDKNNVLENYNINIGPNIDVSKSGNNLSIKSNSYGNSFITFHRIEKRFSNEPIVYIDENNQDLLLPGSLSDVTNFIGVNMKSGTVSAYKLDYDTRNNIPSHQGSLENAKYGLFNESGQLLEEQLTAKDGYLKFNTKLNANRYYIQEITASEGYQIDKEKYYFDINKNNYEITLNVYEKVIKENFEIIKVLENEDTGQLEFEKGIEFRVYDLNDNLIKKLVTSDFGTIEFSLDYGKYILKQHTSYNGYEKIEDYEINVLENGKQNKIVFKDNLIKYKAKLNVKNKLTNENLENINFELYDNENEKICYIVNYPVEKRICTYSTDKEGNILFPYDFKFDEYYIKLKYNENFKFDFENDIINFVVDESVDFKQVEDYRLIELEYFLEEKKEDSSNEDEKVKNEDEEMKEENIEKENEIKKEEINENEEGQVETEINDVIIEEIPEKISENISTNEKNQDLLNIEEGIIVDVPNTLKNNNYILLMLFICGIIIKKLL